MDHNDLSDFYNKHFLEITFGKNFFLFSSNERKRKNSWRYVICCLLNFIFFKCLGNSLYIKRGKK